MLFQDYVLEEGLFSKEIGVFLSKKGDLQYRRTQQILISLLSMIFIKPSYNSLLEHLPAVAPEGVGPRGDDSSERGSRNAGRRASLKSTGVVRLPVWI